MIVGKVATYVVICFQISIFDTIGNNCFKRNRSVCRVVICFQISIFDTIGNNVMIKYYICNIVVICFQISIFDTIGNNGIKTEWYTYLL